MYDVQYNAVTFSCRAGLNRQAFLFTRYGSVHLEFKPRTV
jgi:hypothetical protein